MITILKTKTIDEIDGLEEEIKKLEKYSVSVESKFQNAVIGSFAGEAINILTSKPAEAILNMIEIGGIILTIYQMIKKKKKKAFFSDEALKYMFCFKYLGESSECGVHKIEQSKIWGPMRLKESSLIAGEYNEMFLIAVVIPYRIIKRKKISQMKWAIMDEGGEILADWTTQTYNDRFPDFLKL